MFISCHGAREELCPPRVSADSLTLLVILPERDRSSGVLGKHVILEDTAMSQELGNLGFKADPACFSWSLFNTDSALQWAEALWEILGTGYFVVNVLM